MIVATFRFCFLFAPDIYRAFPPGGDSSAMMQVEEIIFLALFKVFACHLKMGRVWNPYIMVA